MKRFLFFFNKYYIPFSKKLRSKVSAALQVELLDVFQQSFKN